MPSPGFAGVSVEDEQIEDSGQYLGRDAGAVVGHGDDDVVVCRRHV
jgi:hypothetical protein